MKTIGQNKKFIKTCECSNCGAIIQYNPSEINYCKYTRDPTITCPQCLNDIRVA